MFPAHARRSRPSPAHTLLLAALLALILGLFLSPDAQAALQKLAGYEKADDNRFSSL